MATDQEAKPGRVAEGQPPETKDAPCTGSRESDGREGIQSGRTADKAMVDTRRAKQDWTSRAGLVVAVLTALILVWEGWENRSHNRLSATQMVLPDVSSSRTSLPLGIYLKNEGLGPATVDFKGVTLDGRPVGSLHVVVEQMKHEEVFKPGHDPGVGSLKQGTYIGVGSRKTLLAIAPDSVNAGAWPKLRGFLQRRIVVHYEACSVYGECDSGNTADAEAKAEG